MDNHILKFVWRYSRREQILVVLLTLIAFPLLYMTLEIPKWIINNALGDSESVKTLFGVSLQPVAYLVTLCCTLMTLIILSGLLKMLINTYKGIIGERLIRRLRFSLMACLLRFPLGHYASVSPGEMISTISSETEPLAGYIGESIALPLFQGGTMVTILIFMFAQDWVFGVVSVVLIPVQGYLIPKLQKQINLLKKDRIRRVRLLSERIGETVVGATEIRLHGTEKYALAEFSRRFGDLFWVRLEIFRKKYYMKFLNNTIGQITPFLYYLFGGYLVIKGSLTIGALVAAIAAYKDLTSPWRELLNHYQLHEDAKIKYQQITALFNVNGLVAESTEGINGQPGFLPGAMVIEGLGWSDRYGHLQLTDIDLVAEPSTSVAIGGGTGEQRSRLAQLLSGLIRPESGQIRFGDTLIENIANSLLRTRISLQVADPHIFSGTIVENMEYGLNQREPFIELEDSLSRDVVEAQASGNAHPLTTDWVDYHIASQDDAIQNREWYSKVIGAIGAESLIYDRSLHERFDPQEWPQLAEKLLPIRPLVHRALRHGQQQHLVEPLDRSRYNTRLTVLENLLFGTVRCDAEIECFPEQNRQFVEFLDACGILERGLEAGYRTTSCLLEMESGSQPDDELLAHFGLTNPEFVRRLKQSIDSYSGHARSGLPAHVVLLSVFLRLIPDTHPFFEFDPPLIDMLLKARNKILDDRAACPLPGVEPFEIDLYHPDLSVRDNLLFGKVALNHADAEQQVDAVINEIVEQEQLKTDLMILSGASQVGVGGAHLSVAERHTIALGRALMKRPDVLILQDALSPFDEATKMRLLRQIRTLLPQLTLVWIAGQVADTSQFDQVYRLTRQGNIQLDCPGIA